MRTFNIATVCRPTNFEKYLEILHEAAVESGCSIAAYVVVNGPGCYNHALMIEGEKAESFVVRVCMTLQPAKYGEVHGVDPAIKLGEFAVKLEG